MISLGVIFLHDPNCLYKMIKLYFVIHKHINFMLCWLKDDQYLIILLIQIWFELSHNNVNI